MQRNCSCIPRDKDRGMRKTAVFGDSCAVITSNQGNEANIYHYFFTYIYRIILDMFMLTTRDIIRKKLSPTLETHSIGSMKNFS